MITKLKVMVYIAGLMVIIMQVNIKIIKSTVVVFTVTQTVISTKDNGKMEKNMVMEVSNFQME